MSVCQAGCCNIVKLLGRGRLRLCKEQALLRGPQSPAVKGPPPRHAPYVPQVPPEDLDSPLSFPLPGEEWTEYTMPTSPTLSGVCRSGNWPEIWTAGCSGPPAWCSGGPRPPPAHLGVRRWPWGRLGSHYLHVLPPLFRTAGWRHLLTSSSATPKDVNIMRASQRTSFCAASIFSGTGLNFALRNQSGPTPWSQRKCHLQAVWG